MQDKTNKFVFSSPQSTNYPWTLLQKQFPHSSNSNLQKTKYKYQAKSTSWVLDLKCNATTSHWTLEITSLVYIYSIQKLP